MRHIAMFAVVATLGLGYGAWAASTSHARLGVPAGGGIDTTQITQAVKELPATEFVDYSFVFN